jgi:predicted ATPase
MRCPRAEAALNLPRYALEMLDKAGEALATRARHAAWALHFAEAAKTGLDGPEHRAWLDRLDQERDNMRAALEWFAEVEEGDSLLRMVGALGNLLVDPWAGPR